MMLSETAIHENTRNFFEVLRKLPVQDIKLESNTNGIESIDIHHSLELNHWVRNPMILNASAAAVITTATNKKNFLYLRKKP